MLLFVLLLLSLFSPLSAQAGHQGAETNSHFYVIGKKTIIIIDRQTKEETYLPTEHPPYKIYAFQGTIFISFVERLLIMTISMDNKSLLPFYEETRSCYYKLVFSPPYVYIIDIYGQNIMMCDYQSGCLIKKITTSVYIKRVIADNTHLYVTCRHGDILYIYNKDTLCLHKEISLRSPRYCIRHKDQLFVSCSEDSSITVMDITTFNTVRRISVGRLPQSLVIYDDHLYVKCSLSFNIYVIDLTSLKIIAAPSCHEEASLYGTLQKRGSKGYLATAITHYLWILDLTNNTSLAVIDLRKWVKSSYHIPKVYITDNHAYIQDVKINLSSFGLPVFLSVDLFKNASSINLYDEGSAQIAWVLKSIETGNMDNVAESFAYALSCGHPKAYAIAAYAYLKGIFGVQKDSRMHIDYFLYADIEFYQWLTELIEEHLSVYDQKEPSTNVMPEIDGFGFDPF